ncbi:hypothetical protein BAX94_03915 [Elizabethkingia meningoseptica]|uniref:hypothetical protein n=1 Tax=Elizabethkingia meningoseptica TaxID=238 RepID=UPI0008A9BA4E|nr:hypothetical protein [Elizabethkingia meningoseptica]MDE5450589.1 hypothetical protein [Elizabethkingia meningoseptica]MDE5470003.1 hypothetical protein [Elizabethkingia meningoseptica]MDE5518880.1 hypothetical protein [Elizabethkingia meningoseptica]MDE5522761.1 hypothetical protein [Elizabethkingia meningoseptica]OHT31720.1 hypothetical protein BGC12_05370 [Elizabethkingia meningoseptica]
MKLKRSLNFYLVLLISIILLNSCREEPLQENRNHTGIVSEALVKDGRLYFPNKESLQSTYNDLKKRKPQEIEQFVKEKKIEPLRPVITEENEKEVMTLMKARIASVNKLFSNAIAGTNNKIPNSLTDEDVYNDLDDMEEIVGDDAYSAMLNSKAEIQVADNVYKYTDVGLFITPAENYAQLETYLEVRNISPNLLQPTPQYIAESFIKDKPVNEITPLGNDIGYFIANNPLELVDEGQGGVYIPPIQAPLPVVEPSIDEIVRNIKIGEIRQPKLGNIFGKTWVTEDKYESRRRVKVKFYSQNLFLVYAIGCKVKHQYKGWTGLWRKENAEKLGMGVNSITWVFDHPFNNFRQNGVPREQYFFENKMFTSLNNYYNYVDRGPARMPRLPFENKIDGVIQIVTEYTSLSEEQLRKIFYEQVWKVVKKIGKDYNKKYNKVVVILDSYSALYVQYYDFSKVKDNEDVIENIFDWGAVTPQFTYNFGGVVGNGVSITSYKFDFKNPTATTINMYGIAKKNGKWHGAKLIVER